MDDLTNSLSNIKLDTKPFKLNVKPVIKWAGGKRQIMNYLISNFPQDFKNYHEPFIGGASVIMELYNTGKLDNKNVYIGDIMEPLMNCYNVIKSDLYSLIKELEQDKYKNEKEFFLENRKRYNEIKKDTDLYDVERAALFLYLNKTCFNGMYRENSKGLFNVPFGSQKNPAIINIEILKNASLWLKDKNIISYTGPYDKGLKYINKGDFVYMDPPYYGKFTGYNSFKFEQKEQIELRDYYLNLTNMGCKVALSNSDHDFIKSIYKEVPGVKFIEINVKRMINSNSEKRKEVQKELLIINY